MTVMLPGKPVSRISYVLRALIAALLILAFSVWMVARSTGVLSKDPKIYANVPVAAGLIQSGAPVRYQGIKVGEITGIDAGADSSRIALTIDAGLLRRIPETVMIRVLPRTFFGDIFLELQPRPGAPDTAQQGLRPGALVTVDDGPEAMNLYGIFTQLADLIAEVQPEQVNVALAAVDRAIGGRGDELGLMIDNWWEAAQVLESTVDEFLAATPKFRRVAESLLKATPAVLNTLSAATNISRMLATHDEQLAGLITSALGFVTATGEFVGQERQNLITVLDATGKILATVGARPAGLSETIKEANKFGAAGTILFSTGRFNITAVPTFSEPMPYTAADCPVYGTQRGAQCFGTGSRQGVGAVRAPGEGNSSVLERKAAGEPAAFSGPPVIDGAAEAPALGHLERQVIPASNPRVRAQTPNPATVLMLGPMVRGQQVQLS